MGFAALAPCWMPASFGGRGEPVRRAAAGVERKPGLLCATGGGSFASTEIWVRTEGLVRPALIASRRNVTVTWVVLGATRPDDRRTEGIARSLNHFFLGGQDRGAAGSHRDG